MFSLLFFYFSVWFVFGVVCFWKLTVQLFVVFFIDLSLFYLGFKYLFFYLWRVCELLSFFFLDLAKSPIEFHHPRVLKDFESLKNPYLVLFKVICYFRP